MPSDTPPSDDATRAETTRELAMALGRINRALARAYPGPLATGALSALATVVREGPIRVGDLARREGLQPPNMSRIVAELEREGHLERHTDLDDRRSVYLVVTEIGQATYDDVWERRSRALTEGVRAMDEPDQQTIRAMIALLRQLGERIERRHDNP